jgi:AAA15 family ATPase/GTPase
MTKLKYVKLVNYCGYKDFEIDLTHNGELNKWTILYGPNGTYKTSFLNAVFMLSNPRMYQHKRNVLTFRRLKHNANYISGTEMVSDGNNDLLMKGIFFVDGINKTVMLQDNIRGVIHSGRDVNTGTGEISGVHTNELSVEDQGSIFVDADDRSTMTKFQIIKELINPFCEFSSAVYGLPCHCPDGAITRDSGMDYCTDFVIEKKNGTKIHYKRMSDGEKKIATLVSSLFKRCYKDSPDNENKSMVIIDNIEMHIYFKRHMTLIRKMDEYFPDHQFIITTHSPVIINEMDKKYLLDMEMVN